MKTTLAQVVLSTIAFSSFLNVSPLVAAEWPRWLGPNGDNIAPAEGFDGNLDKWDVKWKANVGVGYSAVTVAGGKAYVMGHDGKAQETVYCFDASSGKEIWKFAYDAQLMPKMHPGGPNATPTVADGKVFTVSKDGQALCLTTDKGEKVWSANLVEAMGIKLPMWGIASSPVVYQGKVLFSAGKVIALETATGKTAWVTSSTNAAGYTTPVAFKQGGKDFVATLDGSGLSVLNPGMARRWRGSRSRPFII